MRFLNGPLYFTASAMGGIFDFYCGKPRGWLWLNLMSDKL